MSSGELLFRAPLQSRPPVPITLEARLREIGLIGQRHRGQTDTFLPGDRFLQLITFLGCSPHLRLAPDNPDDENFCQVRFVGPFTRPRLLHGRNTRPPRCLHCGRPVQQWRQSLARQKTEINCRLCGCNSRIDALDWRRNAGLGCFFVQVTEVFPGEAVPLPALLEQLAAGGTQWEYFYRQQ